MKAGIIKPSEQLDGVNLLVVDDNKIIQEFYKAVLKIYPVKPVFALSGEEAMEIYRKNPRFFDVVLMDIRMPGMSGVETMRAMRKLNPDARVIAQTAFALESDRAMYMEMGFHAYLTKPIDEDELISLLLDSRKILS